MRALLEGTGSANETEGGGGLDKPVSNFTLGPLLGRPRQRPRAPQPPAPLPRLILPRLAPRSLSGHHLPHPEAVASGVAEVVLPYLTLTTLIAVTVGGAASALAVVAYSRFKDAQGRLSAVSSPPPLPPFRIVAAPSSPPSPIAPFPLPPLSQAGARADARRARGRGTEHAREPAARPPRGKAAQARARVGGVQEQRRGASPAAPLACDRRRDVSTTAATWKVTRLLPLRLSFLSLRDWSTNAPPSTTA